MGARGTQCSQSRRYHPHLTSHLITYMRYTHQVPKDSDPTKRHRQNTYCRCDPAYARTALTWHISRNVCRASTNALDIGGSGSWQSGVGSPSSPDVECQALSSARIASVVVPEAGRAGGGLAGRSCCANATTNRSLLMRATARDNDCDRPNGSRGAIQVSQRQPRSQQYLTSLGYPNSLPNRTPGHKLQLTVGGLCLSRAPSGKAPYTTQRNMPLQHTTRNPHETRQRPVSRADISPATCARSCRPCPRQLSPAPFPA